MMVQLSYSTQHFDIFQKHLDNTNTYRYDAAHQPNEEPMSSPILSTICEKLGIQVSSYSSVIPGYLLDRINDRLDHVLVCQAEYDRMFDSIVSGYNSVLECLGIIQRNRGPCSLEVTLSEEDVEIVVGDLNRAIESLSQEKEYNK